MAIQSRTAAALLALALALAPSSAVADGAQCHVVDVTFTTADDSGNAAAPYKYRPQIVVWIEDAAGNYVDTIYITRETGTFGLGNRVGRFDLNSGPLWPYGKRITTFPVWSRIAKPDLAATGVYPFPEVDFQNGDEDNLSHAASQSSTEPHFCRPMTHDGPDTVAWDTGTCATAFPDTDKGRFSSTRTTGYPPRVDIARTANRDSADVDRFPLMNPFDAVSQATPENGLPSLITWPVPFGLANGDYVAVVEVSKEFDYNATYNDLSFPSPPVPFLIYGMPYRGQPSVIYRVPFAIDATDSIALVDRYAGYGDPDGLDGNVRDPDSTITTDVPGSGGARLSLIPDTSGAYRVKLTARSEHDSTAPGIANAAQAVQLTPTGATISFVSPGDDGQDGGKIRGYDIRYRAASPLTAENFDSATAISPPAPDDPGQVQTVALSGLLPETDYYVGIRSFDECHNNSALAIVAFTTPVPQSGQVDACFIATAAYGSIMANDVGLLRQFRDRLLRDNVFGEMFVETYYTFGPAVAGIVDRSELLRESARVALGPLVALARTSAASDRE